jgi:hypothetical protein
MQDFNMKRKYKINVPQHNISCTETKLWLYAAGEDVFRKITYLWKIWFVMYGCFIGIAHVFDLKWSTFVCPPFPSTVSHYWHAHVCVNRNMELILSQPFLPCLIYMSILMEGRLTKLYLLSGYDCEFTNY